MTSTSLTPAQESARKQLEGFLEGNPFVTYLQEVSRSGMSARIRVFLAAGKGEGVHELTFWVSILLGQKPNPSGVLMKGCGYSRPMELHNRISLAVFGDYRLTKTQTL